MFWFGDGVYGVLENIYHQNVHHELTAKSGLIAKMLMDPLDQK